MINKILIDTNVLLDYLLTREPFYEAARNVILSCADGKCKVIWSKLYRDKKCF